MSIRSLTRTLVGQVRTRLMRARLAAMESVQAYDRSRRDRRPGELRILYVDSFAQRRGRNDGEGLLKALRRRAETQRFDFRRITRDAGSEQMNRLLLRTALWFRPDVLLLAKAETVRADTLKDIRARMGTTIAYFFPDLRNRVEPCVAELGGEADLNLFMWDDAAFSQPYRAAGLGRLAFWRHGVDPDVFRPMRLPKKFDLVFLGNNTVLEQPDIPGARERLEFVRVLARCGRSLGVFGDGWDELRRLANVSVHPFVVDRGFVRACAGARIVVGFSANHVRLYTSWPRILRCMAAGAFYLTRYFPGIETEFTNGEHLAWFETTAQAVALLEHFLCNEQERQAIAERGRQLVVRSHNWDVRVDQLLQLLAKLPVR